MSIEKLARSPRVQRWNLYRETWEMLGFVAYAGFIVGFATAGALLFGFPWWTGLAICAAITAVHLLADLTCTFATALVKSAPRKNSETERNE